MYVYVCVLACVSVCVCLSVCLFPRALLNSGVIGVIKSSKYIVEREYLTAHIPCTNALHQVTPVNYRILMDLINASSWMTELLISDDRLYH